MRIIIRITIILLAAGLVAGVTYLVTPQSERPARFSGSGPDVAGPVLTDAGADPVTSDGNMSRGINGDRPGHHGESSVIGGAAGLLKNGTIFAVAMISAIGIRKRGFRKTPRTA